jgi:alpha-beta hydrolase superfamily lysophospholipase
MKSTEVHLQTSDGVNIAASYIPGTVPFGAVLVHMMPATRGSFDTFAQMLSEIGLHTLAIDLRGHGDSGGGDYQTFTHEQHQKAIFDVLSAVDFLHKQDPQMKIGFVGASIGASLSMQYCAANPAQFLILLSPGLQYRGIEAGRLAIALPEDLPTYFITALDDARVEGNTTQTETLFSACASHNKQIKIFPEGGHGTEILARNMDFAKELAEWVKTVYNRVSEPEDSEETQASEPEINSEP